MKKLLLLLIIPFLNFGQTPCLDAVANATGAIGEFVPQCEEDGSYSPIQCWWSTGYCWCVNEDGEEIPGTSVATWEGAPNCNNDLCEGVTVDLQSVNDLNIEVVISTENNPDFWCSYCGLTLVDNNGVIVAVENPWTAPSFYGLAGGYSELRTLDIIQNITFPFEGVLNAVNGLMPNVNVDENFIIDPEDPIDMKDGDIPFVMCYWSFTISSVYIPELPRSKSLIKTLDILGKEASNKEFQLHIYDDGTVRKKYLIK